MASSKRCRYVCIERVILFCVQPVSVLYQVQVEYIEFLERVVYEDILFSVYRRNIWKYDNEGPG